jgi:hypothetical protein
MNVAKIEWWIVGVLVFLAVPLAGVASAAKKMAVTEIPAHEGGLPWGAIFIALFAAGGVCVVAFRNANRSA